MQASAYCSTIFLTSTFVSSATGGDIQAVLRGTDTEGFQYIEEGHTYPILAASGYQKAAMGVGIRIALAKALCGSAEFLLLDEPNGTATEENSIKMLMAIRSTRFQTILVSHRDLDSVSDKTVHIN